MGKWDLSSRPMACISVIKPIYKTRCCTRSLAKMGWELPISSVSPGIPFPFLVPRRQASDRHMFELIKTRELIYVAATVGWAMKLNYLDHSSYVPQSDFITASSSYHEKFPIGYSIRWPLRQFDFPTISPVESEPRSSLECSRCGAAGPRSKSFGPFNIWDSHD